MRARTVLAGASLAWLSLAAAACTPAVRARTDSAPGSSTEADSSCTSHAPVQDADAADEDEPEVARADAPAAQAAAARSEDAPHPAQDASRASAQDAGRAAPAQLPVDPAGSAQASQPLLASMPAPPPELWRIDRGPGEVPLLIPRDESLVYEVHLNLGWLGNPNVGKVTMLSQVRPFYSDEQGGAAGEQALISGRAEGSYKVYTLDNLISAAILPQDWPHIVHRNAQTGTENRTRELMLGTRRGKEISRYRADGHCKGCKDKAHFVSGTWPWQDDEHCKKCKRAEHRVWKDPVTREVPEGTLDMITAVMLARSMVIDGRERIDFPLVDRNDLWRVQLTRGKSKRIETTAGKFDCVAIDLRTSAPEPTGEETTKFEGLFGIHGTISIWIEEHSGVPVRIDGTVPAGPIELDATVELRSARGAPHAFAVLGSK